ncbi:MAG: 16S rRNA (cytidine(1402)-2'-O)-methyltransferase [Verrucomicrobia bacterium]|nr:MAG: 16S rRNA (cytidine(1402)-2'-O)-methyltransferase [Verrucomicrobiota bacterium]
MQLTECQQKAQPGHLYIVSTPIGNLSDITLRAISILDSCDLIACEDTRVTGNLLHYLKIQKPTISYRDENEKEQTYFLIEQLKNNKSVALVSDAGTPTLSDPGFRIVRECRRQGFPVVPIPGPSALLSALSAAGLPTNDFRFFGFLPPKSAARIRFLDSYKDASYTLILYESAHRIEKFMDEMLSILEPTRIICLAREITKLHETFLVGEVANVHLLFQKQSHKGEFVVLIAPRDFHL